MWRSRAALAAVTIKWYSSGSWEKGTRQKVRIKTQVTLACSGTCLGESLEYCSKEESKRAGWFSSITFSQLKNSSSWWMGHQPKVVGGLHGWSSSWVHSNMKRACKKQKKGQEAQKQCRNTVQTWRNRLRKVKTHLELKLVRDMKCKYLGFWRYISNKRKTKENTDLQ